MQTHLKLSGITIIGVIATLIMAGTEAQKFHSCCQKVSRTEFSGSITGYRIQKWNPPCVQAVIFKTEEGEVCIHLKQTWVLRKIRHFERSSQRNKMSPTSSVPQYSTGTTRSTRELITSSHRNNISPTSSVPQYSTGTTDSTRELITSSQSFTGATKAKSTSPTN